jgi:hypothetical protein
MLRKTQSGEPLTVLMRLRDKQEKNDRLLRLGKKFEA